MRRRRGFLAGLWLAVLACVPDAYPSASDAAVELLERHGGDGTGGCDPAGGGGYGGGAGAGAVAAGGAECN
jgi:hypothetical protein